MKLKRTIAVAMAGLLCMSALAGCGGNSSAGAGGSAASTSKGTKGEINYILAQRSEFQTVLADSIVAEGEKQGYRVNIQNGDNDSAKQLQYVETCRNAGQEAVIIQPIDASATQSLIDAAGDMKVVFVNCPPTDLEELAQENVCYVGSNETEAGYFQADYLSEYFKAQGKTEISYILLEGLQGYIPTVKRSESVVQKLKDNGIDAKETTAPLICDFDRPTAQEMIAPVLTSGATYDCIIANNDAMALGAVEACKAANIDIDFPIVGIDCTADGAQAIVAGDMAMTVFQDPVGQGRGAFIAAMNMINGDPLNTGMNYSLDDSGESYSDSIVWVPFEPVTADNVADYM